MTYALIATYVWGGLTTWFALYLFIEIGRAVNGLLPGDTRLILDKSNVANLIGVIVIVAIWPIVLPLWAIAEWHDQQVKKMFRGF